MSNRRRMPRKTARIMKSGAARGTTKVRIVDTSVANTTAAPRKNVRICATIIKVCSPSTGMTGYFKVNSLKVEKCCQRDTIFVSKPNNNSGTDKNGGRERMGFKPRAGGDDKSPEGTTRPSVVTCAPTCAAAGI